MSYKYLVKFDVTGNDHHGWCSGADADSSDDDEYRHTEYSVIVSDKLHETNYNFVKNYRIFTYYNRGCTSEGSGYCNGFGQKHTAIWATLIDGTKYDTLEKYINEEKKQKNIRRFSEYLKTEKTKLIEECEELYKKKTN